MLFAGRQTGKHAFAQVTFVKLVLQMSGGLVGVQVVFGGKTHLADAAHETVHFDPSVCSQVEAVVFNLTEALPTFGAAVRARSRVQVHVVLEFELGGQLESTNAAAEVSRLTGICGNTEETVSAH